MTTGTVQVYDVATGLIITLTKGARDMSERTIEPRGWTIHESGEVQRRDVPDSQADGNWTITGAVERNNLGGVVRHWTLAQIIADPSVIPWKFKNGTQRTCLTDLDHGIHREMVSPSYTVV
jgi:hypothetical protein